MARLLVDDVRLVSMDLAVGEPEGGAVLVGHGRIDAAANPAPAWDAGGPGAQWVLSEGLPRNAEGPASSGKDAGSRPCWWHGRDPRTPHDGVRAPAFPVERFEKVH